MVHTGDDDALESDQYDESVAEDVVVERPEGLHDEERPEAPGPEQGKLGVPGHRPGRSAGEGGENAGNGRRHHGGEGAAEHGAQSEARDVAAPFRGEAAEEAAEKYPNGWEAPVPYLRFVKQPG